MPKPESETNSGNDTTTTDLRKGEAVGETATTTQGTDTAGQYQVIHTDNSDMHVTPWLASTKMPLGNSRAVGSDPADNRRGADEGEEGFSASEHGPGDVAGDSGSSSAMTVSKPEMTQ